MKYLLSFASAFVSGVSYAATVAISCGAVGQEFDLCKTGAEAWAKETKNQVKIVSSTSSTTERLALYQQLMGAKSADIDVFLIDVIWPGIIGHHLTSLNKDFGKDVQKEHFSSFIENNTVNGELLAVPWFMDAGLLYYRKDLLEKYSAAVPKTWQELTDTAKKIQEEERKKGNKEMWGFVFQGKAYEGLTCGALEWMTSYGAGTVVDESGKVTINNPQSQKALNLASSWIGNITPRGVLNYSEEEARGVFQSGKAIFMRNWPYAWSLSQTKDSPVKNKVGVTKLPTGDKIHAATLGGWSLAISKYSRNQDAAISLVKYLTGAKEQKRRALVGSFNPTLIALYKDKEIVKANPFMGQLYDTFSNAVARPSRVTGAKYSRVSTEFWDAVHQTLSGKGTAEKNLISLETKLNRISRNGKW